MYRYTTTLIWQTGTHCSEYARLTMLFSTTSNWFWKQILQKQETAPLFAACVYYWPSEWQSTLRVVIIACGHYTQLYRSCFTIPYGSPHSSRRNIAALQYIPHLYVYNHGQSCSYMTIPKSRVFCRRRECADWLCHWQDWCLGKTYMQIFPTTNHDSFRCKMRGHLRIKMFREYEAP